MCTCVFICNAHTCHTRGVPQHMCGSQKTILWRSESSGFSSLLSLCGAQRWTSSHQLGSKCLGPLSCHTFENLTFYFMGFFFFAYMCVCLTALSCKSGDKAQSPQQDAQDKMHKDCVASEITILEKSIVAQIPVPNRTDQTVWTSALGTQSAGWLTVHGLERRWAKPSSFENSNEGLQTLDLILLTFSLYFSNKMVPILPNTVTL